MDPIPDFPIGRPKQGMRQSGCVAVKLNHISCFFLVKESCKLKLVFVSRQSGNDREAKTVITMIWNGLVTSRCGPSIHNTQMEPITLTIERTDNATEKVNVCVTNWFDPG